MAAQPTIPVDDTCLEELLVYLFSRLLTVSFFLNFFWDFEAEALEDLGRYISLDLPSRLIAQSLFLFLVIVHAAAEI